jgi:hypothetical protein
MISQVHGMYVTGKLIFLKFCWPCIIVYQYNETNVIYFLFRLLRMKGLYLFRTLLAQPQETLHKRHFVYCETATAPQTTDIIHMQYTKCRLCIAS